MTTATKEVIEQKQYLTFLLANEEYAIGILKVKEIIEYDTVTTVPKTPKWVRGVINLRGAVVPVVDLAIKFGLELKPVTKTTCIVIVETQFESQNTTIGILVDAVSQVMELAAEDLQPVPEFGTRVKVDYLLGMAQLGSEHALLPDCVLPEPRRVRPIRASDRDHRSLPSHATAARFRRPARTTLLRSCGRWSRTRWCHRAVPRPGELPVE